MSSPMDDYGQLSPAIDLQRNKQSFGSVVPSHPDHDSQLQDQFEDLSLRSPGANELKGFADVNKLPVELDGKPVNAADLVNKCVPTVVQTPVIEEKCEKKYKTCDVESDDGFIHLSSKPVQELRIGAAGKVVPGDPLDVKNFVEGIEAYKMGVDTAIKMCVPVHETENLVVNIKNKKAVDIALGSDSIKGVYLQKSKINNFDTSSLKLMRTLGQGQYGKVDLYFDMNNKRHFAIKSMKLNSQLNPYEAELLALAAVTAGGENVIAAHALYIQNRHLHYVMDVAGDTLESYMNNLKKLVNEQVLRTVLKQCCRGLQFLNRLGCIHLDIKPQNISIGSQQTVKLLDLGSCSRIGEETDKAGLTPKYVAKEVAEPYIHRWRGLVGSKPVLSAKADVYGLGCSVTALARRQHVWDKLNYSKDDYIGGLEYIFAHEEELHADIPVNYGSCFVDLMGRMMRYDHQQRYGVQETLKHPFLQDPPPVHSSGFGGARVSFDPSKPESLQALQNVVGSDAMQLRRFNQPTFIKNPMSKVKTEPPKVKIEQFGIPQCSVGIKPEIFQQSSCSVNGEQKIMLLVPEGVQHIMKTMVAYPVNNGVPQMCEPRKIVPATPDPGERKRCGPTPMKDDEMEVDINAPSSIPVPVFEQIMNEKTRRSYLEEEVNLKAPCVENAVVPEFTALLNDQNDYTRTAQSPRYRRGSRSVTPTNKTAQTASRETTMIPLPISSQFVDAQNQMPTCVDLSMTRKQADNPKRTQKRTGKPYSRKNSKY